MTPFRENPLGLQGRHILVTGAASGIGQATSVLLDQLGATLSLVDRTPLTATLEQISSRSRNPVAFDLLDTDGIQGLLESVVNRTGPLTGLVHAAGIQSIVPAKALTMAGCREIYSVNAEAALALAKPFTGRKISGNLPGAIVFISSVMALAGSPGAVAYSMSKAALHGLARSLALELAAKRIRVNCIAPGFVHTPLFSRTAATWSEDQCRKVEASHPLGFGEPEDVAHAVAFLMADTGRWITGTTLVVDGGYLAQ